MGKVKEVLNIEPLEKKVSSFGWKVKRIDGHNYQDIEDMWEWITWDCPSMVICDTLKGKGWKRAEGCNTYHYKSPSREEYEEAIKELSLLPKESS